MQSAAPPHRRRRRRGGGARGRAPPGPPPPVRPERGQLPDRAQLQPRVGAARRGLADHVRLRRGALRAAAQRLPWRRRRQARQSVGRTLTTLAHVATCRRSKRRVTGSLALLAHFGHGAWHGSVCDALTCRTRQGVPAHGVTQQLTRGSRRLNPMLKYAALASHRLIIMQRLIAMASNGVQGQRGVLVVGLYVMVEKLSSTSRPWCRFKRLICIAVWSV